MRSRMLILSWYNVKKKSGPDQDNEDAIPRGLQRAGYAIPSSS